MSLQSRFHNALVKSGNIPVGSRVLVAVSGGADSVALLSLLHQVAGQLNLTLEAAHLDHALRLESCEDVRSVERLCLSLNVPLSSERRDVAEIARQRKGNLEEVARDVRRDYLLTTARSRGCQLIALGHHADDQAETFMMRLLRGSSAAGLAGMCPIDAHVVRPLLPFRRADLIAYLQQEQIPWREDLSNRDLAFTRNRIRHQLLPLMESFNPNINNQLAGLCEQLAEDNAFWAEVVAQEMVRCGSRQEDAIVLDRTRLLALSPALAGRVIRAALQQVRGDLRGLTAAHVDDTLKLVDNGPPQGELFLPGAWLARRYEKLLLYKQKPAAVEPFAVELSGPGIYLLPGDRLLRVSLEKQPRGEDVDAVEFAAASAPFPLRLRHYHPGDRLRPSGMDGTKKLQNLFVDLKMTKEQRQAALLLLKDDEVLWVLGLRRSEGRRPVTGEQVLRIVIEAQKSAIIGLL